MGYLIVWQYAVWNYQQEPQIGVGDNSNRLTELPTGLGAYKNVRNK